MICYSRSLYLIKNIELAAHTRNKDTMSEQCKHSNGKDALCPRQVHPFCVAVRRFLRNSNLLCISVWSGRHNTSQPFVGNRGISMTSLPVSLVFLKRSKDFDMYTQKKNYLP